MYCQFPCPLALKHLKVTASHSGQVSSFGAFKSRLNSCASILPSPEVSTCRKRVVTFRRYASSAFFFSCSINSSSACATCGAQVYTAIGFLGSVITNNEKENTWHWATSLHCGLHKHRVYLGSSTFGHVFILNSNLSCTSIFHVTPPHLASKWQRSTPRILQNIGK